MMSTINIQLAYKAAMGSFGAVMKVCNRGPGNTKLVQELNQGDERGHYRKGRSGSGRSRQGNQRKKLIPGL